jgi:1-acyl-sn-glycerol-3-phosphate acyltransferase
MTTLVEKTKRAVFIVPAAFFKFVVISATLKKRVEKARKYSERVSECGYLAPPPSDKALAWLKRTMRVLIFIQVGKLKVIGKENLALIGREPVIVAPNHVSAADAAVLPMVLNGPARYLGTRGVFRFLGGLGALAAGPVGVISVELKEGQGGPAREAAVKVLTSGQTLVMFPEGWAYLDGVMGPAKKGVVRIAREAAEQLKKDTYIVPMFLRYGRYPGSWIRKVQPPIAYLFLLCNPFYRKGCTVVIGKAIPSSQLPADDAAATALWTEQVMALDPQASPC